MNIDEIIKSLNIKDKIKFLTGKDYWSTYGVSEIQSKKMADGPNGIRKQLEKADLLGFNDSVKSICYPTACLSACTFNQELIKKMGTQLGNEANSMDISLILGPGLNIKRNPLGGRGFEYFSEDPILSGKMAGSLAKGIEETGVGACLKHYACNNQEKERFISNSLVDERTLHELYLKGFNIAIKEANPTAIMTSYNLVNSDYMCENKELLQEARLNGFNGMFITDWGGLSNPINSFKNGLNLEMPGVDKKRWKMIYQAYKKNLISIEEINEAIKPVIKFLLKEKPESKFNIEVAKKIALDVATEGIVMLKNDDNILPLGDSSIGVLGVYAKNPRIQGSGSSKINPLYCDSFLSILDKNNKKYNYNDGYDEHSTFIEDSSIIAKQNKTLIIFLGLPEDYESEGFDKASLDLPLNQIKLVDEMYKLNKNIIVVMQSGCPVILPFKDKVKGLFAAYLGGVTSGEAIYNLIFGISNPSGRLAETWPNSLKDTVSYNCFPGENRVADYKEGIYVGYSYYHSKNLNVAYPFGYGLSYTNINYTNFEYMNNKLSFDALALNTDGYTVLQLYLENKGDMNYRRLIDFKKIYLKKNELTNISFDIKNEYFQMYCDKLKRYVSTTGKFILELGTSSFDIIYSKAINTTGEKDYIIPNDKNININSLGVTKKITINSTLEDIKSKKLGALIVKLINKKVYKIKSKSITEAKMLESALKEMPLRAISMGSNGIFNCFKIQGLIDILNGRILKGIIGLLK